MAGRKALDTNLGELTGWGLGLFCIVLIFLAAVALVNFGIVLLENFRKATSNSDAIQRSMTKYSGGFIALTICSALAYVVGTLIHANREMLLDNNLVSFVSWGLGVSAFGLLVLSGMALLSVGFVALENFRNAHGSSDVIQRSMVKYSGVFVPLAICSVILVGMGASIHANREMLALSLKVPDPNLLIVDMLVWLLLITISYLALREIRSVLSGSKGRTHAFQAYMIAIIVGIAMVALLFVQPYLDAIFPIETDSKAVKPILEAILFAGGSAGGWSVWYVCELRRNGDFWYLMLLTILIGLSWYARLSAPQEAKVFAFAVVLASLVKIGLNKLEKDRSESTNQQADRTGKPSCGEEGGKTNDDRGQNGDPRA